jgi:hypothetical protein
MRPLPFVLLSLVACDGGSSDKANDSSDTGGGDTSTNGETGETGNPFLTASLNGTVLDPDGAPLQGFRTNVCKEVCKTSMTGADGSYEFTSLEPWTAAFYVQGNSELGYATPYAPVTWADNEEKTIDIRLLDIGEVLSASGGGDHEFSSGIRVSFANGDMVDMLSSDAIEEVSATAVDDDARPPLEVGETVLAVWYLGPFEAHGSATVSVRNDWALATGETVSVWWAETPETSTWVNGGTLTAINGEDWLTGSATIGAFTTVVITQP